ncbi:MAG: TlpA family protein disulfide reductase [Myxococcaceae bacterium]|nr:TlpA family protein disulfide reductase [Myxococcaceae bacterium]
MQRTAAWLALAATCCAAAGCAHVPAKDESPIDYYQPLRLERADAPAPARFDPARLYGRPALVTFFATWCFPCLGQLPLFAELKKEHAADGLEVVAVGMDLDGRRVLEPFAAQAGLGFPVLIASEALVKGETPYGRVRELPTTVLFARDGSVVAAWPGLADAADLRAAVDEAVKR